MEKQQEAGKREGEVMMLNEYEDGDVSPGMWIVERCFFRSPDLFRLHW